MVPRPPSTHPRPLTRLLRSLTDLLPSPPPSTALRTRERPPLDSTRPLFPSIVPCHEPTIPRRGESRRRPPIHPFRALLELGLDPPDSRREAPSSHLPSSGSGSRIRPPRAI
mmetsp:Transcript_21732/g.68097  ORF Transcript_21732/g.68097 Transcript_21732/m.68097 type:complete len:112 (-) Transcript_21732:69-404(-)